MSDDRRPLDSVHPAERPAGPPLLLRVQCRRRQGRRPASQQEGTGHQRGEPGRERAGGRQRQPLPRGEPEQEPERAEAREEEDPGGATPECLDRPIVHRDCRHRPPTRCNAQRGGDVFSAHSMKASMSVPSSILFRVGFPTEWPARVSIRISTGAWPRLRRLERGGVLEAVRRDDAVVVVGGRDQRRRIAACPA